MTLRIAVLLLAFSLVAAGPASAQTTRTELLEREREKKAQSLQPYQAGKLERGLLYLEEGGLDRLFAEPRGPYLRMGGMATGSGVAFGPGYRRPDLPGGTVLNLSAAISTRKYRQADLELLFPPAAGDRLELRAHVRYRDYPQEDFFGIGNDAARSVRTSYLLEDTSVSLDGTYQLRPWLRVGGRVGGLGVGGGPGADPRFPSIEERFGEAEAPGLADQPRFLHGDLFIEADTRDAPGNPRSGGHYRVTRTGYRDRTLDRYSFGRTHLLVARYVPFFENKRVLAARAQVTVSDHAAGQQVPFYLQPTLGGDDSLRGFRPLRFRDEHALLLNLEYRWEAFAGLDMALFGDAGKVAAERRDLTLDGLHTAYGLGFRFNARGSVFLRLDVARSREGFRYFLKFGPVF